MRKQVYEITTRVAAENVPEEIKKRLIGKAEMEMVGESAVIRKILDDNLPPFSEVEFFYNRALQKQRARRKI